MILMIKVAINGLGRIGRATVRLLRDIEGLELVAINDLAPTQTLAYLLRYDSVWGRFPGEVSADGGDTLHIDGRQLTCLQQRDPTQLPWQRLGVDVVFECTGVFTRAEQLQGHISAGARHVMLSAPAKGDGVVTCLPGVAPAPAEAPVLACTASCTTNCIAPVAEVMARRVGVAKAIMTTVHAYTASQGLIDQGAKKLERGRAGAVNLIPTSTGAARATAGVLPHCAGRFDGLAVRVPVPSGSLADVCFVTNRPTSVEEVNGIFREEADTDRYRGILGVTDEPIVSTDILMDGRASIVDLGQTRVVDGDLVKVLSWYDNEWGYASQMVRQAIAMFATPGESRQP
jgi:glyceraldehyde 3-phosphate dehydrogenase